MGVVDEVALVEVDPHVDKSVPHQLPIEEAVSVTIMRSKL